MTNHNIDSIRMVSYITVKALEFANEKCSAYLANDPKRMQTPDESRFLEKLRTVTLGFGMNSFIVANVAHMVEHPGLVVVGGLDIRNAEINAALQSFSDGRLSLIDKLALPNTFFNDRIERVVLFHEQNGLDLRSFFQWVAAQPHTEEIEIIIYVV